MSTASVSPTTFSAFLVQGLTAVIAVLFPGPFRRHPHMLAAGPHPPKAMRAKEDEEVKPCPLSASSGSTAGPQWSQTSASSESEASGTSPPPESEACVEHRTECEDASPCRIAGGAPPLIEAFFKQIKLESATPSTVKLIRRAVRLLEQCDYPMEEVCSVLAHASAYFEDVYGQCGHRMTSGEIGYILVVLIYMGHCHVLDEACPLRLWHQHLCQKYCSLPMLDAAVMRLMKMRGYILRLKDDDLEMRYSYLLDAAGLNSADRSGSDFCFRE